MKTLICPGAAFVWRKLETDMAAYSPVHLMRAPGVHTLADLSAPVSMITAMTMTTTMTGGRRGAG